MKFWSITIIFIICSAFIPFSCMAFFGPTPTVDTIQRDADILAYRLALQAFPNQSYAPWDETEGIMLEGLLSYSSQKYSKALGLFKLVININQSNPKAWYYYGMTLFHLNQTKDAMDAFNRTLVINPEYYDAWYGKSLVYHKEGDVWAQSEAMSTALEIKKKVLEKTEKSKPKIQVEPTDTPSSPFPVFIILFALFIGLIGYSKGRK